MAVKTLLIAYQADSFVLLQVDSQDNPDNPSVQMSCSPDIMVIQELTEMKQHWDNQSRTICDVYRDTIAQVRRDAKRRIISSNRKEKIKKLKDITTHMMFSYKVSRSMECEEHIYVPEDAPSYLKEAISNFNFCTLWEAMLRMIEKMFIVRVSLKRKLNSVTMKLTSNWSMGGSFVEDTVESYYLPNRELQMNMRVFLSRSWSTLWCVITKGTSYYVNMDSTDYHNALKGPTEYCDHLLWELRKAVNEHGPYLPEKKTLPEPSVEPTLEYDIMIDLCMDFDQHVGASIVALRQCPDYLSSRKDDEADSMWGTILCVGRETMKLVREETKWLEDRDEEDLADENKVITYMKSNGPFQIQITVDVFVRRQPTVTVKTVPASLGHILDTHPGGRNPYPDRIGFACSSLVEKLLGVYQKVKPYLLPLPGQEPDVSFTYVRVESTVTFESISYGPNSPADLPSKVRRARKRCTWSLFDEMAMLMFREYYFSKFPLFPVPEGVNPIDWID